MFMALRLHNHLDTFGAQTMALGKGAVLSYESRARLLLCVFTVTAALLILSTAAMAAAPRCVGLNCSNATSQDYVPGAHRAVPSVNGLGQLVTQKKSGFYEIPAPIYQGGDRPSAVVYLSTPGQLGRMPASVRDLTAVRDFERAAGSAANAAVLVVIDHSLRYVIPADRGAAAARHRPRAQAADGVPIHGCQDRYFCQYGSGGFGGGRLEWYGPTYFGTGWWNLGGAWNNITESMVNHRDNGDSLMADGFDGGGTRYCAQQHSEDAELGNNPLGNDHASSVALLPSTDDRC